MKCYLVIDKQTLPLGEREAFFVLQMLQRPTVDEATAAMLDLAQSDGGTRQEIAKKLGVSSKTIWEWRRRYE